MTPREIAAQHALRRRARLARIRKTVAALSVCVFIVLFAGIYVEMAAGRDPVLGAKTAVTKKATVKKKAAVTTTATTPTDTSSSSAPATSQPSQPSPVTTSQS